MTQTDSLIAAAVQIARIECKQDPAGCTGPWCAAQGNIRRALEARGINWKMPLPEPKHIHLFVNDVCACGEIDD